MVVWGAATLERGKPRMRVSQKKRAEAGDHVPPEQSALRISLFGCPRVIRPGARTALSLGRPANVLLAFLLLQGHHLHPRNKLASTLWCTAPPDYAAHSFRTTLWRLRRALEPPGIPKGTYLLATQRGEVGFNWESRFWLDIQNFEGAIQVAENRSTDAIAEHEITSLEHALRLYEGGLLEGFFDDWILHERERLRHLYIQGLIRMMRQQAQQAHYEDALSCGRSVLDLDPLRESVHRDMMRLHALNGQRSEALGQYEQLALLLQEQLDVEPMEETTAVYVEVLRMEPKTRACPAGHPAYPEVDETLRDLHQYLEEIERCHGRFRQALNKLSHLVSTRETGSEK